MIKKYHSYVGVLSAALIFASWVITNAVLKQVDSLELKIINAKLEQSQYQNHQEIMLALRNTEKQLTRIELRGNFSSTEVDERQRALSNSGDNLQWVSAWQSDMNSLQSQGISVINYALSISENTPDKTKAIQYGEAAINLANSYNLLRDNFEETFGEITKGVHGFSLTNPPDNWRDIFELTEDHYRKAEQLIGGYIELTNNLHLSTSKLNNLAERELERSKTWAEFLSFLSAGVFVAGTLLSLYAKLFEAREKHELQNQANKDAV